MSLVEEDDGDGHHLNDAVKARAADIEISCGRGLYQALSLDYGRAATT